MSTRAPKGEAPSPAPEPEPAKINARYVSEFVKDIFGIAEPNLSQKDFEAIHNGLFELACSSLRRASAVAEGIGCVLGDDKQGYFDLESVPDILFHLNDTMDACPGFFEISREAGHAASHYEEHRRLMEITGKQP